MKPAAMEEDGSNNFKALRARFQAEALLAQTRSSRPAVAEKPKHVPPPAGHCPAVAGDSMTPVVPRAGVRDGSRASADKRPFSFPPQPEPSTPPRLANGDRTTKRSLKDRHMPLVLPALPGRDGRLEPPAGEEPGRGSLRRKGLLLPFMAARAGKPGAGAGGDQPSYDDLADRPCSAPAELPSAQDGLQDGAWLHSDQSAAEHPPSSPDVPVTPPRPEAPADPENRLMSTLERARRKFSRRQLVVSSKPRSLRSPDYASREKVSPLDGVEMPIPPPPLCLPPLACISARPFFKATSVVRKPAFDKPLARTRVEGRSVKTVEAHPPRLPLKRPVPDSRTLGPLPAKPPRPPSVDLSRYCAPMGHEVSPGRASSKDQSQPPPISNPVLDAPEFPDFETWEVGVAECEVVDIAALALEALDLVGADALAPAEVQSPGPEAAQPDPSACDPAETSVRLAALDLNLGSPDMIPLDPADFPEPLVLAELAEPPGRERWSHSRPAGGEGFTSARSGAVDEAAAEGRSFPEETSVWSDGIHARPGASQQDSYNEACDNVYEDVESIARFFSSQTSTKRKAALQNPYAEHHFTKEDPYVQKRPQNPWASVSGEHAHFVHHVHCKEHSSPNTADYKEQRKREKQRLDRERREQKERDKKENEMKKKFKVTGDEEPMYHARVTVASKVRKNDLPVKSGDTVSIIRTTNCPKGKWLARDSRHKYGYISVMNVELNLKEMLEIGKKAQAAGRGGNADGDTISIGSRSSSHPVLTSSFTDDSEEWACEDETLSPSTNESHSFPLQPSEPEVACAHVGTLHTLGNPNLEDVHTQTRHEALQKLAFFFQHTKDDCGGRDGEPAASTIDQELDFPELELLPPPPLYADSF